jgi:hypothetical protein
MSCRRVTVAVVLLVCCAWSAQASAHVSRHRAAQIRAALSRQVKRHPGVLTQLWFLRRAGLVQFKLPVTLRLRSDPAPTATADLGASLGSRSIALGGSLAAEVVFSDSLDGGAIGNVGLEFLPSDTKFLRSSSIPLLWNSDVSDPGMRADANLLAATADTTGLSPAGLAQGCGDFTAAGAGGTAATPPGYNALFHGFTPAGSTYGAGQGLPGYPYYDPSGPGGSATPAGYLPIYPGVDAIDNLKSGAVVGDNDWLGPSQEPFPSSAAPGEFVSPPNVQDTVLRTNALALQVAARTGGQANLFGQIPGKAVGIDVSLSLRTSINAIARIVDQDVHRVPLESGDAYPAYVFQCRQVWTGAVENQLPGIRLQGELKIAPAITADGHLRIAKATVSSPPATPAPVVLSACLFPASPYAAGNDDPLAFGFSDLTTAPPIPPAGAGGLVPVDSDLLPVFADAERFPPSDVLGASAPSGTACNAPSDALLRRAGLTAALDPLLPAGDANGYTTTADGSQVTVAGEITVNPVSVDVLIGDV